MKSKIIMWIVAIFSFALFQRCSMESKKNQIVISQELLYDSINKETKLFDVYLTTIINFKNTDLKKDSFTNLSLIIDKDTLGLIPNIKDAKLDENNNNLIIEFTTNTKFTSKAYKNDSLTNKILNSKIIIDKSQIVEKRKNFILQSLILAYPVKENGMKFE